MNEETLVPIPNVKPQSESLKDWTLRYLLGEDVFISYSRVDGRPYALDLANQLASRNYSCKFDQWGTVPGEKLPRQLKQSLRGSAVLVLICTEAASKSNSVKEEIDEFLKTGRFIVPVDVGGWLGSAGWEKLIRGIPSSSLKQLVIEKNNSKAEDRASGDNSDAEADLSEDLVDRIEKTFTFSRKDRRIKKTLVSGVAALALILIVGLGAAVFAAYQMNVALNANKEAKDALNARNDAVQERNQATNEKNTAIGDRDTARQEAAKALTDQKTAEENARKAEDRERVAKVEADRQGKIAESTHLATESNRIRNEQGRYLEVSIANALKSRAIERGLGLGSLSSYDALRETTAIFPELIRTLPQEKASNLTITADNRTLIALRKVKPDEDPMAADIWNLASNVKLRTIGSEEQGYVYQVSGDGNHIMTRRGNQYIVWNALTGVEESTIPTFGATDFRAAAISHDGSLVVTAGHVWSVKERKDRYLIAGIERARKMAFSENGIYLAVAHQESGAGVTKVYYTANGSLIDHETPFFHEGNILSTAISNDGEYVSTVSRFTSPFASAFLSINVWAVNEFDKSEVISLVVEGIQDLSFTSKHLILVAKDGAVQMVDLKARTTSSVGDKYNPARRALISPNGESLLTINTDSTVRLWDLATGREQSRMYHKAPASAAVFTRDGSEVITAGTDNLIKRWRPSRGLLAGAVSGGSVVSFLRTWLFSTDGKLMAANTLDDVTLWDTSTGSTIRSFEPEGHTLSIALSPNSHFLVTAGKAYGITNAHGGEYSIQVWNTKSDKKEALAQTTMLGWVKDLAVSNDGSSVLMYVDQDGVPGVVSWDTKSDAKTWLAGEKYTDFFEFAEKNDPASTGIDEKLHQRYEAWERAWKERSPVVGAIAPDASFTVTISNDGQISAIKSQSSGVRWQGTLNAAEIAQLRQHQAIKFDFDRVRQLESIIRFIADGNYVSVTFPGLSNRVLNLQTGREVNLVRFNRDEKLLRYSPQGDHMISQLTNTSLRVIATRTGKEILRLSMQGDIKAANISFDEKLLVAESEDRSCEIWDLRSRQRVGRIRTSTEIKDVAFSGDSNRLLTREGGAGGSTWIRLWIWRPKEIESIATRLLTSNASQ